MKLAQFRLITSNDNTVSNEIKQSWANGNAFKYNNNISVFPAYRIRIQTIPGVQFNINDSLDWVTIGYDGVYELDLGSQPLITGLKFSNNSLENVIAAMDRTGATKEGILLEIFFEGGYA